MRFLQGFCAAPHGEISPPDGLALSPTPDRSPESASPVSVFPLRELASLPWTVAAPQRRRRLAALGCALCLHLAAACALAFLPDTPPRPLPAGYVMEVGLMALSGGKTGGSGGRDGNTGETAGAAVHAPQRPAQRAVPHAEQASGPPRPAVSAPERRPASRKPRSVPRMSAHPAPQPVGSRETGGRAVWGDMPGDAGSGGGATSGSGGPGGTETAPVPGGGGQINPLPPYPELARRRGQEGESVLLVSVDAQGHALEVRVQRSSGHALLDRSALDTVRRWMFSPATRDGRPVPGQVVVPVRFRLH